MNTTYQIPATTHLGEVSLRIMNLDRSIKFYTEVVGLKLLERSGKVATLTADGKQSLLRLEEAHGWNYPAGTLTRWLVSFRHPAAGTQVPGSCSS